jgi:hypothetical protein
MNKSLRLIFATARKESRPIAAPERCRFAGRAKKRLRGQTDLWTYQYLQNWVPTVAREGNGVYFVSVTVTLYKSLGSVMGILAQR